MREIGCCQLCVYTPLLSSLDRKIITFDQTQLQPCFNHPPMCVKDSGHYWQLSKTSLPTWCISTYMHKITNLWKFELNRSSKLRDNNERKNTLSHEVVCFQMLDFETLNSIPEVSKSNLWKISYFLKNTLLQREPFLTMFYTTNLSPLLLTLTK